MTDLKTRFLHTDLKNPIIIGASNLSNNIDLVKRIEDSGAAAIVYKSLFEEQIQLENLEMGEIMDEYRERNAEMINLFPDIEHAGPQEHLHKLSKLKESLEIPVFASLNAVYDETWVEYAKEIEQTGVDGIELNFYAIPKNFEEESRDIENKQIGILKAIKQSVNIPIGVKLSPYYSSPLHFIKSLDSIGVDGLILFNRLFQPEIDIESEKNYYPYNLSSQSDNKLAMRYSGLLFEKIVARITANTGIHTGEDVIKMILSGAENVQIVSTIYKNKPEHIIHILEFVQKWMNEKGYSSFKDFRGKLSRKNTKDPHAYKRAQYVDILMKSDEIFKKHPLI